MKKKQDDSLDLINKYINDCKVRDLSTATTRTYKSCILIFYNEFLKKNQINVINVDKDVLISFISYLRKKRNVGYKRLQNYFASLSGFYDYLIFEGIINTNPVLLVRKRYLKRYKDNEGDTRRKCPTNKELTDLINSIMSPRDKAIVVLLAKTGIRRGELISLDITDVDMENQLIRLKPTPKRTNKTVYFDEECTNILRIWLKNRDKLGIDKDNKALFLSQLGTRLKRNGVYVSVTKWAEKIGLHKPESPNIEDHLSPHCLRHWFTTVLIRNGMPREYIKELRGDSRSEAIDIYNHIDKEEMRRLYLACMPCLGV